MKINMNNTFGKTTGASDANLEYERLRSNDLCLIGDLFPLSSPPELNEYQVPQYFMGFGMSKV